MHKLLRVALRLHKAEVSPPRVSKSPACQSLMSSSSCRTHVALCPCGHVKLQLL